MSGAGGGSSSASTSRRPSRTTRPGQRLRAHDLAVDRPSTRAEARPPPGARPRARPPAGVRAKRPPSAWSSWSVSGSASPFTWSATGGPDSGQSPSSASVAAVRRTWPPTVALSTRLATLTALPTTAYLARCSEPMLPTTASPVWRPMPISKRGQPPPGVLRVDLDERRLHGERGGGRPLGVVRVRDRGAVHREDRVPDELVDGAPVGDDDLRHPRQIPVEDLHHLGRDRPARRTACSRGGRT